MLLKGKKILNVFLSEHEREIQSNHEQNQAFVTNNFRYEMTSNEIKIIQM